MGGWLVQQARRPKLLEVYGYAIHLQTFEHGLSLTTRSAFGIVATADVYASGPVFMPLTTKYFRGRNPVPTVLFICTANQCRSPMAEVIGRDLLTRANPAAEWQVGSVGVRAVDGYPATPASATVAGR